jgi:serralysin
MAFRSGALLDHDFTAGNAYGEALSLNSPAVYETSAPGKLTTAFITDDLGVPLPPGPTADLILIGDAVPDDTSTTVTLTVDAAHTLGTINTIGDQDFYKVQLTAGQTYDIGMYTKAAGPSGVPMQDAYLELYDAGGHLVAVADGGGANTPEGLDALLNFTATTGGTYYVNARAFDQDPTNGTTGDGVGDYEVFVATGDPSSAYHPRYTDDSPLYSIDWGTQVDGTAPNPDGDEGPRPTGNPQGTPVQDATAVAGKNVITYYLAKAGDVFIDEDPTTPGATETMVAKGWSDWEIAALHQAFAAYEKVADIVYVETQDRASADFKFVTYLGTPGPGVSLLGRMSPPGEENAGQAEFNAADERWTQAGLAPGGFTFTTLIHEMGHGHGLAHPHDNGGHSGVMHGVTSDGPAFDYTNGDFDLNQSVYTMMSYEDGWQKSPYGQAATTDPYGWLGGLMAFDIAAIQDKYGVNEDTATGNDVYELKDVNAPGTMYESIWDAGGVDEIRYTGARDANIDLRPATLKYEYGGGGWISYAWGIYGGYTIANGVTIENATGGDGNDTLIGNDAANILTGGLGNDSLDGGAGSDTASYAAAAAAVSVSLAVTGAQDTGAAGTDTLANIENLTGSAFNDHLTGDGGANVLTGGMGADVLDGGAGSDTAAYDGAFTGVKVNLNTLTAQNTIGAGTDTLIGIENLRGSSFNDTLTGNGVANVLEGGAGNDILDGAGGVDTASYAGAASGVTVTLAVVTSQNTGGAGNDTIKNIENLTGSAFDDSLTGSGAINTLIGGAGADHLYGGGGNDILDGGDGADVLDGGLADDKLFGGAGVDSLTGGDGKDTLDGGLGADTLIGGLGDDTYLVDDSGDTITEAAGAGTDTARATAAAFTLGANVENLTNAGAGAFTGTGNELANVITGGAGADTLLGLAGNDKLLGGDGADVLTGGAGADTLTGGLGADAFVFGALSDSSASAADTIVDFSHAEGDVIDLAAIDANSTLAGDQAFSWLGTGAFTHHAGELRYVVSSGNISLQGDVNGDGVADLVVKLTGITSLSAGDFHP